MAITFGQPLKMCPKCGYVIPDNTTVIIGKDGEETTLGTAYLICETCAINAAPPMPKKKRLRRGEVDEAQAKIEVQSIYIT